MGINGLWDVLGDGDITPIAHYAANHFVLHKRPLRVAVDEAGWRFNNLTDQQVAAIRMREPAANPVEKTILWRLLRLLKLNIDLIFVFDGPGRPWKRGRRGGNRVDYDRTRLLCLLLDHLKIPHHRAKAEAEAECARLNSLGLVDAVWSDDSDAFMFGCSRLIKDYKVGGKRQDGIIQVYEAASISQKHDLDAQSMVLFAMLAGGDYDAKGLENCGPALASKVARKSHGVARALCLTNLHNVVAFRDKLNDVLNSCNSSVIVPPSYPNMKALGHYRNPTVSTDQELHNLKSLKDGWRRPIDQPKLRVLLRQKFNIWTKGYLKHVAPIFLVRALTDADTLEEKEQNLRFALQRKVKRGKKASTDGAEDQTEVRVSYLPVPAVEINVDREPTDGTGILEDWNCFAGKDGLPYDPYQRIECELLLCFIRNGLSAEGFEPPPNKVKAKAAKDGAKDDTNPTRPKRKRKACDNQGDDERSKPTTNKSGRKSENLSGLTGLSHNSCALTKQSSLESPSQVSRSSFKMPKLSPLRPSPPARPAAPRVVNLCDSDDDSACAKEVSSEGLQATSAIHNSSASKSAPRQHRSSSKTPSSTIFASELLSSPDINPSNVSNGRKSLAESRSGTTSLHQIRTHVHVPVKVGETFDRQSLRELRAESMLLKNKVSPSQSTATLVKPIPQDYEVIDLT